MLSILCAVALAAPAQDTPEPARFPSEHFSITAPSDGWSVDGGQSTPAGFKVSLQLTASAGMVGASVLVNELTASTPPDRLREIALAGLDGRKEHVGHELLDAIDIAGFESEGADIEWHADGLGEFIIRQRYVASAGRSYLLQAHAPKAGFEDHASAFDRFFGSFEAIEPRDDELDAITIARLANRCGSEVDWADDWESAAARAKAEGRHVLVVISSHSSFEIPDSTQLITFTDEDVITLVRERLVPVRLTKNDPSPLQDRGVYGLSATTFGIGFVLLTADGEFIADTPHYEPLTLLTWAAHELDRHPEREVEWPDDAVESAKLALDRGQYELAQEMLDGADEGRADTQLALARIHEWRFDGKAALTALEAAVEIDPSLAATVAPDIARLMLREQEGTKKVIAALAPALDDEASPAHTEALFVRALAEHRQDGFDAARDTRLTLVREHADSRWAWLAASYLQLEPYITASSDKEIGLGWPYRDAIGLAREPLYEARPRSEIDDAEREALAWLRAAQREDGSWPSVRDLGRTRGEPRNLITVSIDAIACRALLAVGEDHHAAALRGIEYLLREDLERRADPPPVMYMDYTSWAAWAQIELVVDAIEAGVGDEAELREFAGRLVSDLVDRVRRNGGWSYYMSNDIAGESATEQSISFTTAAVTIGLVRARDAGISVPEGLIEGAAQCLEVMRGDDKLFAYMLHYPTGQQTRNAAPGSAGRGPVCELAISAAGDREPERMREVLSLFSANADALDAEVGKALMHCGADSQGCHYPFFDYMMAARAARSLSPTDTAKLRAQLTDLVLSARLEDGSFQDTPLLGPTFGTSAALLILHTLRGD